MTNEEKAQQIIGCNRANCLECGGSLSVANGCTEFERIKAMAQWKDEQYKQEKQQWIDKACEFWEHKFPYIGIDTIKEFVDAMKGE